MSSKIANHRVTDLQREYERVIPTGQKFSEELVRQLNQLMEEQKISLGLPIQTRIKSWESLIGKIERKSLDLYSIKDLPDLIGVRIIVLFRRDLKKITEILDNHFEVLQKEDTSTRLTEAQFGYQSIHYIIQLPNDWFALPTLSGMKGLKTEVQIRTVAQHIWAASSHVLQYKHESSVPTALRRTIHRVSALLETVDLEFERVLSENEAYTTSLPATRPDRELDVITLEKVLDELLPGQNKSEDDPMSYGDLLEEIRQAGLKNAGDFTKVVKKYLSQRLKQDRKIAAALSKSDNLSATVDGVVYGGDEHKMERWKRGVFWSHVGLIRAALEDHKVRGGKGSASQE